MRKGCGSEAISFGFMYLFIGLAFWLIAGSPTILMVGAPFLLVGILIFYWGDSSAGRKWRTWPTLDEYVKLYPQTATSGGIACYKCRSKKIFQFGFEERDDARRIHKCMICNTFLYRTKHQT